MNSLFLIWSFSCWAEPLTDRMSNGLTGQHNVHVETLNAMPSLMDMKCRIDGMIDCMSNIDLLSKCSNWVTPFVIIVFNLVFSIKRGLSWLLEIISVLASFPPLSTTQNTLLTISPCVGCCCFWKAPLMLLIIKDADAMTTVDGECLNWMAIVNHHHVFFEQPPRRKF